MESYTCNIMLKTTADHVFDALTKAIPSWWTEMYEGHSDKLGDYFIVHFGDPVYKKMQVVELIDDAKVVWFVEDSRIAIPGLINQTEWIGTSITWEIIEKGDYVEVNLTHKGLVPTIECYAVCTDGWRQFIASLKLYLETGKGTPFQSAD